MGSNEKTSISEYMPEELIYLIIKRLTNTIDLEESQTLQKWMEESSEHQKIFNEVSDIWMASNAENISGIDSFTALAKVKSRINQSDSAINEKPISRVRNFWFKAAAVAILTVSVSLISYFVGTSRHEENSEITEISAPMGSRSRINLPDGTKVWLNGGSTLRYSNSFNKTDRSVSILGEGYFDVKHNQHLPFVVNTKEIRIKVLGTAFNIKAYPDDGAIETTLERGSLAIEKLDKEGQSVPQMVLAPNQKATYIKNGGHVFLAEEEAREEKVKEAVPHQEVSPQPITEHFLVSRKVDTQIFTSWKDNKLVFRNEPFESLIVKLERWYGVTIELGDAEIMKYHFNGTFEKETIHDILNIIQYTLPINYTIKHDQVFIDLDKTAMNKKK